MQDQNQFWINSSDTLLPSPAPSDFLENTNRPQSSETTNQQHLVPSQITDINDIFDFHNVDEGCLPFSNNFLGVVKNGNINLEGSNEEDDSNHLLRSSLLYSDNGSESFRDDDFDPFPDSFLDFHGEPSDLVVDNASKSNRGKQFIDLLENDASFAHSDIMDEVDYDLSLIVSSFSPDAIDEANRDSFERNETDLHRSESFNSTALSDYTVSVSEQEETTRNFHLGDYVDEEINDYHLNNAPLKGNLPPNRSVSVELPTFNQPGSSDMFESSAGNFDIPPNFDCSRKRRPDTAVMEGSSSKIFRANSSLGIVGQDRFNTPFSFAQYPNTAPILPSSYLAQPHSGDLVINQALNAKRFLFGNMANHLSMDNKDQEMNVRLHFQNPTQYQLGTVFSSSVSETPNVPNVPKWDHSPDNVNKYQINSSNTCVDITNAIHQQQLNNINQETHAVDLFNFSSPTFSMPSSTPKAARPQEDSRPFTAGSSISATIYNQSVSTLQEHSIADITSLPLSYQNVHAQNIVPNYNDMDISCQRQSAFEPCAKPGATSISTSFSPEKIPGSVKEDIESSVTVPNDKELKPDDNLHGSKQSSCTVDTSSYGAAIGSSDITGDNLESVPSTSGENLDQDIPAHDPVLEKAYKECLRTGKQTLLIKEELRRKIIYKRCVQGKKEFPPLSDPTPSSSAHPLTEEEEKKKKRRQELNRIAAANLRGRRKADTAEMINSLQAEVTRREQLLAQIKRLESERDRLISYLSSNSTGRLTKR